MINKTMKKHTNTKKYTRAALIDWKHSIKKSQKQCYVTGSTENLEIHHLSKPFSEMFKEAHKTLGIQYHEDVKDYAESDLDALTDLVVDMHKDVTALVLNKDIHKALHNQYGLNFTMDQVNKFKAEYQNNNKKGGRYNGKVQ